MYCHMSPLERKTRTVLDSGFRIPDSFSVEIRFQISIASRILDSGSSIPDSKAQDSGLHKQNHPDSGIHVARHFSMSIRLTCWGKGERKTRTGKTAQREKRPLSTPLPPLPPSSPLTSHEGLILGLVTCYDILHFFCILCVYLSIDWLIDR